MKLQLTTLDAAIAKETKEVVQKEEEEATVKAQRTQEIADSAQRDLDEALPALVLYNVNLYYIASTVSIGWGFQVQNCSNIT